MSNRERSRCQASVAMGLAGTVEAAARIQAIPKIGIVSRPRSYETLSGRTVAVGDADLVVRMISVGQPHRAIPLTAAICAAVAARLPGSVPQTLASAGEIGRAHV